MTQLNDLVINFDAFSHGQVKSKLWLCEEMEKSFKDLEYINLEVYGSWYGSQVFLMLIRNRLNIKNVNFYDLDLEALRISKKLHDFWLHEDDVQLNFNISDCQLIKLPLNKNSILINTSCEHFSDLDWWHNLAEGTYFIIQTTDMEHEQHISPVFSLEEWMIQLAPNRLIYEGCQKMNYIGIDFSFTRFMLIGIK